MQDNNIFHPEYWPPLHDTPYTQAQIEHWFTHGTLSPEKGATIKVIHDAARQLALLINSTLPSGPETNASLDRLQEAVLWANTAISRG